VAPLNEVVVFDGPEAMCRAALLGSAYTDRASARVAASRARCARGNGMLMPSHLDLIRHAHAATPDELCARIVWEGAFDII